MEEPGRLQSMESLESDTTEQLHFHFSLSCIGEGNGNPLQCSCLENPRDGRAWWAAIYGVAQSRTRLKRLSSSSSSMSSPLVGKPFRQIDTWKTTAHKIHAEGSDSLFFKRKLLRFYLAVLGLTFGRWNLQSWLQHAGSFSCSTCVYSPDQELNSGPHIASAES